MANTISTLPFAGTAEQEARLDEVISAYKGQSGALIPVLQKTQEIYGYLPIEVEEKIATGLGISLEKVYAGRQILSRILPLRRCMRSGSGSSCQ